MKLFLRCACSCTCQPRRVCHASLYAIVRHLNVRRRPEVRWRRTLQDLRALTELQRELSDAAISVLNSGGIFGYATCSPHFAETSAQVQMILKNHPELEQLDIAEHFPKELVGAIRGLNLSLWTGRHETDSMFLAIFKKRGE